MTNVQKPNLKNIFKKENILKTSYIIYSECLIQVLKDQGGGVMTNVQKLNLKITFKRENVLKTSHIIYSECLNKAQE